MNRLFVCFLMVCLSSLLSAQEQRPAYNVEKGFSYARYLLSGKGGAMQPEKAKWFFQKGANVNHAASMNALGLLYKDGLGCKQDLASAKQWFEKASALNYAKADYNLGMLYRYGLGVEQNDSIAFAHYTLSAQRGYAGGMYCAAYLLYTGQGVEQSYEKAIPLLQKGAALKRSSCQYLLGMCYRNGYGIAKDEAKAKALFVEAAKQGYNYAKNELQIKGAEFIASKTSEGQASLKSASIKQNNPMETGTQIERVAPHGTWIGVKHVYDFSGKHILNTDSIRLTIEQEGKAIRGVWFEGDSLRINVEGTINNNALYFVKGEAQRLSRYAKQNKWQLQQGALRAVQKGQEVFLSCKFREYTPDYKELGKPSELLLKQMDTNPISSLPAEEMLVVTPIESVDTGEGESIFALETMQSTQKEPNHEVAYDSETPELTVNPSSENKKQTEEATTPKAQAIAHLKIYPVPFHTFCTVEFSILQQEKVTLQLYDLQGKLLDTRNMGTLPNGKHRVELGQQLPQGTFLLQVRCGAVQKGQLIIKQ